MLAARRMLAVRASYSIVKAPLDVQPHISGGLRRCLSTQPEARAAKGGPVSWATLGLVLTLGAGVVGFYNFQRSRKHVQATTRVDSYGKPMLGGPWSLVTADGRPVTSADFEGQYVLLYFGFTFCPDICPSELVKMSKVVDNLEKSAGSAPITPIFITLDPHRDSCAQVGAYVKDFHPKMVGLTGTPAQIGAVAKAFRVYFADVDRREDDDDYLVDHSIVMYLLSPEGQFVDFFTQLMTADEISNKIAGIMQQRQPQPLAGWSLPSIFGGK